MKKFNKETLIEIIGVIIFLALIGGIISYNVVCSYDPSYNQSSDSNIVLDNKIIR